MRITTNGSADHSGPSYDFYFRRMRFYINGAINNQIGIIANTDVSYTQVGAAASDVTISPVTVQNSVRFASPTIVMNEALGYWTPCKEFVLMVGLQLLPWVHESLTDITKFAALDEQTDATERGRPPGFFGRDRDVGVAIRGVLFGDGILSYRIGVFNGVQTIAGKGTPTATGLTATGTTPNNGAVNYPAYTGVNPGDAPSFDGFLRINILGVETGYAMQGGIAYDGKSYLSVGAGANIQPRAIAAPARGAPGANYQGYFVDLHGDFAFGDNELVIEAGWVRTVYQGSGAPLPSASGLALINNAGNALYGSIGVRFGFFYPYFAIEDYMSNLNDQQIQSTYQIFGTGWGAAAGRVGSLTTYHGGIKLFGSPPPGNQFMINLDLAFQGKAQAGNVTVAGGATPINGNQVSGTLEFQWKI
ncbi:MAG TPA: hypothetical protein VK454_02635 [Myxococcaceae bacterium]|nr:hypothetical protein [Myxococcaceae bacterium]